MTFPRMTAALRAIFLILVSLPVTGAALGAPVLTNGGFEQNPPSGYGNHIGWPIAPWVLGSGNQSNVVEVDGPGGQSWYGNSGPASDASGGAGHYLDIANGSNDFYQEFTPLCSGEVQFGAYFATRDNSPGTATVTIKDATGGTDVSAPATVSIPGGDSENDPWTLATFTTTLSANTTYRFHVAMDNNMNMDNAFVNFGPSCTEHEDFPYEPGPNDPGPQTTAAVEKLCEPITYDSAGNFVLPCHLNVTASTPYPASLSIADSFTVTGASSSVTSPEPWTCSETPASGGLDVNCTLAGADIPASGSSVIDVTMTFPADTPPEGVYNCADGSFAIEGQAAPQPIEQSCVRIELPEPPVPPLPSCTAFVPELSCDDATGETHLTLNNALSGSFDPSAVQISVNTGGVSLTTPDPANPLSVILNGVTPGQSISLTTSAVQTGAGSQAGLDKCCMGEVTVEVPQDYICVPPPVLEVTKTCEGMDGGEGDPAPQCVINIHYEGPAPDAAHPITLSDAIETGSETGLLSSTDNWSCDGSQTQLGCSISAQDAPGTDWSNWDSTLVIGAAPGAGGVHSDCVTAEAGALSDTACWSNGGPRLSLEKTGPEICYLGEPCVFTYTITNTSTDTAFDGPIGLDDDMTLYNDGTPLWTMGGGFVSMTPPLCTPAQLNDGTCAPNLALAPGQSQSWQVGYVPPNMAPPAGAFTGENCAQLGQMGGAPSTSCHQVTYKPPRLTVDKSGPDQCAVGQDCTYTITIAAGDAPYSGNVLLMDAPTPYGGFQVTSISPSSPACGSALPANPLACVVPVNLPANGTQTYTVTITPLAVGGQVVAADGENCASLMSLPAGSTAPVGDYSFDASGNGPLQFPQVVIDTLTQGGLMGDACVNFTATEGGSPQQPVDLAIAKRWAEGADILAAAGGAPVPPHGYVIDVTQVLGQLQPGDVVVVDDLLADQIGITPFGPPVAAAPWQCSLQAGNAHCEYTVPASGPVPLPPIIWPAVNNPNIDSINCADVHIEQAGATVPDTDAGNDRICVTVPGDNPPPPPENTPEINLMKTCAPFEEGPEGYTLHCTLNITTLSDFSGTLVVDDLATWIGGTQGGGTITSISGPNANWACTTSGAASNAPSGSCTFSGATFLASDNVNIAVVLSIPPVTEPTTWKNCPAGSYTSPQGAVSPIYTTTCVTETVNPPQQPVTAQVHVEKQCAPIVETAAGLEMHCTITVQGLNDFTGYLRVSDEPHLITGSTIPVVSSLTAPNGDWLCTGWYCTISGNDFGAGDTAVLNAVVTAPNTGAPVTWKNCSGINWLNQSQTSTTLTTASCDSQSYDPGQHAPVAPSGPHLELTKTATGPCTVNPAAQSYGCDFRLSLRNTGTAATNGPLALSDVFGAPTPTRARITAPAGWVCTEERGKGVSCLNAGKALVPGAQATIGINLRIPGLRAGGRFENCAVPGIGESGFAQAAAVQALLRQVGIDGGPVDGKPGRRTSKGIRQLQTRLGLAKTGRITPELLSTLGLSGTSGATPSCVTVDLPPMPAPPLICDSATTIARADSCQCRYRDMYQRSQSSCGCVKGTRFVKGRGCVKATPRPATQSCPRGTKYVRGKGCVKPAGRICPNGRPPLPVLGCSNITIGIGGGKPRKHNNYQGNP